MKNKSIFRPSVILNSILFILIAASVLVFCAVHSVKNCYSNASYYYDSIDIEKGKEDLIKSIKETFTNSGSVIAFPPDEMYASINENKVLGIYENYTKYLCNLIIVPSESYKVSFESEELHTYISTTLEKYCNEYGYEYDAGEADEIYGLYCDSIERQITFMPSAGISILNSLRDTILKILEIEKYQLAFAMTIIVLMILSAIVNRKHTLWRILFRIFSPLWCGIVTFICPLLIFKLKYNSSSLILEKSSLYYYIDGVVRSLYRGPVDVSIIFLSVVSVILIVVMIFVSKNNRLIHKKSKPLPDSRRTNPAVATAGLVDFEKKHKKHHHHSHSGSENSSENQQNEDISTENDSGIDATVDDSEKNE